MCNSRANCWVNPHRDKAVWQFLNQSPKLQELVGQCICVCCVLYACIDMDVLCDIYVMYACDAEGSTSSAFFNLIGGKEGVGLLVVSL